MFYLVRVWFSGAQVYCNMPKFSHNVERSGKPTVIHDCLTPLKRWQRSFGDQAVLMYYSPFSGHRALYELKIIQAWQNYAHPSDVNNMLLMHFCADILVQLHDISALCCFFPLYKLTFIPNYSNSFPLLLFLKEKERISTKWCNDELYLRFICEFPTLLPFLENKNTQSFFKQTNFSVPDWMINTCDCGLNVRELQKSHSSIATASQICLTYSKLNN